MEESNWGRWAWSRTKQAGFRVKAGLSNGGVALKEKIAVLQPVHSFKRLFSATSARAKEAKQRLISLSESITTQLTAHLQELKTPKDPVDRAVLYRCYILHIPLNIRLGFIAWSAGLMCYATTGLRARLRRTGLMTLVLGIVLTPDFRPWKGEG